MCVCVCLNSNECVDLIASFECCVYNPVNRTRCLTITSVCMCVCVCVYLVWVYVNWWHSALQRAVHRAHRSLRVCVSVRRLSSPSLPNPAWTDPQKPGLVGEGNPGHRPRGRSLSVGTVGGCGGLTQMGLQSSSSYPLYTPGSYGCRTAAARPAGRNGRSYCHPAGSGRSRTQSRNGGWSVSCSHFPFRCSRWCGRGHRVLEAADW